MKETTGKRKGGWFWVGVILLALLLSVFIPVIVAEPSIFIIAFAMVLLAVPVGTIIYGVRRGKMKESVCTNCGYMGRPRRMTKGSFLYEMFLWYLFILPGLLYTIWRLRNRYGICPKCKQTSMIPVDTPMGQELLSKQQKSPEHYG